MGTVAQWHSKTFTTIVAYSTCAFELLVVGGLSVTVCRIWVVLSGNEHLRANEKSMMPKIVFSVLIWLSGLSLIAIFTYVSMTTQSTL